MAYEWIIGAVAIGGAMVVAIVAMWAEHKEKMLKLEKGIEIEKERKDILPSLLVAGLVLIGIGTGIGLGLWYGRLWGLYLMASFIPGFIGAGLLISYLILLFQLK